MPWRAASAAVAGCTGSGLLKPMQDDIETRRGQAFRHRETESATGAGHERRSQTLRRHSADPAVPNMSKDPTTKPKQVLSGLRHDSAEFGNKCLNSCNPLAISSPNLSIPSPCFGQISLACGAWAEDRCSVNPPAALMRVHWTG